MKHMIALLPFLALAASAQEDVYTTLATGDRVQVTFRTGGSLVGTLVPPPAMGPNPNKPKKLVDLKAAGAPFSVQLFQKRGDPAGEAQAAVLNTWKKDYPEASVTVVLMEAKESVDLIKLNNVVATPTIILRDTASGRSQAQVGLQSAERLTAGLARLRSKLEEEKVDYVKEQFLTLDVRLEYPGLNGTMSLSKKDIKEVRKLQKLDEATRKRLEEEHRKIKEAQSAEEAARRELESKKTDEAKADIEKTEKEEKEKASKADEGKALLEKAEKIKSQEELLKTYPPELWTEERKQTILNKSQAKLPISTEERVFLDKQGEWAEAVKAAKAKKEKEEKEKATQEEK
ncbi:MAG TPA: hypothetical protein VF950_25690 [Planctomycetota bacterium]